MLSRSRRFRADQRGLAMARNMSRGGRECPRKVIASCSRDSATCCGDAGRCTCVSLLLDLIEHCRCQRTADIDQGFSPGGLPSKRPTRQIGCASLLAGGIALAPAGPAAERFKVRRLAGDGPFRNAGRSHPGDLPGDTAAMGACR